MTHRPSNQPTWLTENFYAENGRSLLAATSASAIARQISVSRCYGNILGAYREHPEAKFLSPDGSPCDSLTRGLLRRSHIVAGRHRHIGKETSRHWEQGDDPSMVDFQCKEYTDGKVVADSETRKRILKTGIRRVARESGVNRETVALIANGNPVKQNTLATVVKSTNVWTQAHRTEER